MEFFIENIVLFILAIGSAVFLVWPRISKHLNAVSEVGPLEIVQIINKGKVFILDIRPENEFREGHLLGSKNIPDKGFEDRISEIEKFRGKNVIIVATSNGRAFRILMYLRKKGFENMTVLSGGITAWQQANLPLEKVK